MTSRWMRKLGLGMSLIVTASQLIGMTVIAAPEVEPEYEDGEDFGDTLEKEFEDERNDEVFEEEIIDIEDELQMEIEENEVIFGSTVNDSDDNDTSQKAQSFTLGSTIKGSIAPLKDVDFYSFTLSESGKVTLDMTSYMKNYVLSIYDTSSNVLWYIDDKAYKEDVGFREDEYYIYLEKGTYYLKVTGQVTIDYDGYLSTGNYFIETSFVSVNANESEPNNSVANANTINLGSTVKGLIAQNDKMDFYAFTLGESGSVKLEMTSYLKNYSFIIYDKTGEQIWYADDKRCNESVGFREDQYNIDLEKGTYYLKVTGQVTIDYDGYLATGNYSIKTSFVSANATEDEPNNNIANANKAELGDIIRGLIAQNDKIDYYKFVLDKSENVSLKITAYMKNYTLVIYDKSGDRLWYADDKRYNESVGFREDDFNIDLEKGTYYLKVTGQVTHDYDGFLATGKYCIVISGSSTYSEIDSKTPCLKKDATGTYRCYVNGVRDDSYTGLALLYDENVFVYVKNGSRNQSYSGYVSYEGGLFYVADGTMASDLNGLIQDPNYPDNWYYLAGGQAQTQYTGLAQYDGEWFYVENGKLNTRLAAFVSYDGGLFYVGAGRIMREVSGLAQDPNGRDWYYLSNGQAQTQYTGLAMYDGAWFFISRGKLAENYTGYVDYNGGTFYVVNGMVR